MSAEVESKLMEAKKLGIELAERVGQWRNIRNWFELNSRELSTTERLKWEEIQSDFECDVKGQVN